MLEVRPALPTEYDRVGELTARTYVGDGYAGEDYADVLRDVASRAEAATVLVALDEGDLVGTVTLVTEGGPYSEQAEPGAAVIRMLAVDPPARGVGAGTALVQACVAAAREAGCTVVRLSSQREMTAAHRVYERLGFVRTPERDWRPVPDLELITYALPLVFCGHCGEPLSKDCGEPLSKDCGEALASGGEHGGCALALTLEPPRYCTRCRRRMVVQVHPTGWSARCVEHGTLIG